MTRKVHRPLGPDVTEKRFIGDNDAVPEGWFETTELAKAAWQDNDLTATVPQAASTVPVTASTAPPTMAEPPAVDDLAEDGADAEPERAHNEDGTFAADDPETPHVNEAYEPDAQPRKTRRQRRRMK